jgi:acyl carrier protein
VNAEAEVRRLLAEVVGDPAAARLAADMPLLSGGLGLDSVAVVRLLAAIRRDLGVDVADEDLDLDSLASVGTLAGFVAARHLDGECADRSSGEQQ